MATAFSDPQGVHTAVSSQWQLNWSDSFTSPSYDSGVIAYSNSQAVPVGTLSNDTNYYWHVRYLDSSGVWTPYSTSTKFIYSSSILSVNPLFGSTVVDEGDAVKIDAQLIKPDGSANNTATVTISIYDPAGTKVVTDAPMPYIAASKGIYRYPYTIPASSGSYLYEVTAVSGDTTALGAANFEVRTIAADVSSAQNIVESEQTAQTAERLAQDESRTTVDSIDTVTTDVQTKVTDTQTKVTDVQTKVTDTQTKVSSIKTNMDILIGAMIVTQGSVNDLVASTTAFVSSLTNSTTNFYKNAVLTFTSGDLDGQSRRISAYDGSTKQITLDPALTSAPANGDTFTIITQNVRVEEQVADHEAAQAIERATQTAFRADTTARLTSIESKIDTITTNLNTVDTNLDTVLSTINFVRSSQQKGYKVELSDVSEIQAGNVYRAKLTILDYESNPIDAASVPTIEILDSTRAVAQASTTMTKLAGSAGVYEFTSILAPTSVSGLWETIVSVNVGGAENIIRNDYWQVTGAPAQVVINTMADTSIPTVSADVTITNEGSGAFEYKYEWCVVSAEDDQCGGGNDVYHATAAKLIAVGDDFSPTLTATVSTVGDYWFKLIVYYGTEASGASRSFTATTDTEVVIPPVSGGSSGGGIPNNVPPVVGQATNENIYAEVRMARNQLDAQAQKLTRTLELLGGLSPALKNLLSVTNLNTESLIDIQNKVADLQAVSASTRRLVEQKSVDPIVETYMKFNSVEIHFLITNPDSKQQTVKFKAFLPEEAKPEHIIDKSGLSIEYDANAGVYFVSGNITLGPNESVTKKVEMKDIWVFSPQETKAIQKQVAGLFPVLSKTQYEAQGAVLKNEIEATLETIILRQEESYSSPQDHIVAYRENKEQMKRVVANLDKLRDLVVQSGASRGVVGQVGGIQTFATWAIILAVIFGFGLLSAIIFAMWRHQTMLAAMAMGMSRKKVEEQFGGRKKKAEKPTKNKHVSLSRSHKAETTINFRFNKKQLILTGVFLLLIVGMIILGIVVLPKFFEKKDVLINQVPVAETTPTQEENTMGARVVSGMDENVQVVVNEESSQPMVAAQTVKILETPIGWLNVRDQASVSGKFIEKLIPGEVYEYASIKDGWYEILLKNGTRGWVIGNYVQITTP